MDIGKTELHIVLTKQSKSQTARMIIIVLSISCLLVT